MKVLIVPNYGRPAAREGASILSDWLEGEGLEVVWAHDKKLFPDKICDTTGVDLVISLGGDGTLLRAAKIIGYQEIPLMGISYGHLGFLTIGGPNEMKSAVAHALAGELHVSRRATLDIEAEFDTPSGERVCEKRFALNDFSLSHGVFGDMIEFDITVSGHHVDRMNGDGFVVATATGSTGYALAAGGPIVQPEFKGMVCVPVAAHSLHSRAFLTSSSDVVEISISPERKAERLFFADGQPMGQGLTGVKATIRRGPGDIILLDHSAKSFYENVSRVFYGKGAR